MQIFPLSEANARSISQTTFHNDNQRNKHIYIQYHYACDVVAAGKVEFVYCPTEEIIPEILTEPLDRAQFEKLALWFGVGPQEVVAPSIEGER